MGAAVLWSGKVLNGYSYKAGGETHPAHSLFLFGSFGYSFVHPMPPIAYLPPWLEAL